MAGAMMAPADLKDGERLTGAAHDGCPQNRSAWSKCDGIFRTDPVSVTPRFSDPVLAIQDGPRRRARGIEIRAGERSRARHGTAALRGSSSQSIAYDRCKAQSRIFFAILKWISPLRPKDFRVTASRAAPITQPPVPQSSVYSPLRTVPYRRDTLNDTVKASPNIALPKAKTRAGPDNATQDRIGPDNATQTSRARHPEARQENRRIKNKTVPVRKTIYSRFK
ncbi:unnamed protein product [Phytophthora fragariaefolia]|uniref:Unnamed protein product n=1 Tax=Phytophthora fragariaefolia TaxID=1490495 RepID=A0A9W6U3Z3_9STRA|nr:unnamed protein product [Phytophthora fragariaefolia]